MVDSIQPGFLSPDEAKVKFGELKTGYPASTYLVFDSPEGRWEPVFDFYLKFLGYRLTPSFNQQPPSP